METQKLFFRQIKDTLPGHLSLVDEVAELLEISYDSAYRRIRAEKLLSMEEVQLLSNKYNISLDTLFSLRNDNVVFRDFLIGPDGLSIKDWLRIILHDMVRIQTAKDRLIMYSAKDPPLFHYFQIPEIGAFKTFFWQKTLLQFPEFDDKKFTLDNMDEEIQDLGMKCLAKYIRVPTIELWNVDTFIIAFSQMEYYWVSGLFEKKDQLFLLCEKFDLWLRHIQKQAELGYKYIYGTEPTGVHDNFKLYLNEVVLNDNSIYVEIDGQGVTYITDNVLSLLITTNSEFCQQKKKFLDGLCRQSSLISHVNAKERSRFFNRLLKRIEDFKNSVS